MLEQSGEGAGSTFACTVPCSEPELFEMGPMSRGAARPRLCLLLLTLLGAGCTGAGPMETDPIDAGVGAFAMNQRLGRGVNFGNALEAPNEGDWGVTLEARHFQRAAEAGFATIRLPVRWSAHAAHEPPYTIDPAFFERVDWAIDQALTNDLNIIVNVHHYDSLTADPVRHEPRWLALWRQVAQRYRDRPPNVLFEPLNEPYGELGPSLWNGFLRDVLEVIRESNPNRNVVVGPVSWNNTNALPDLDLPDDRHLIVTVHFYEPFQFTHQGASWASGSDAWLGTEWRGTDADKAVVSGILERAADWGTDHGRPIFLGEFGAYSAADMNSRARWTAYVAREAERLDMSWAYWEFMAGFGLYIPEQDAWRQPLKDALLPP